MNRPKAVPSANLMNQRIKIEPPNYYRPANHGMVRQNQSVYYNKAPSSCPMMPPLSETPTPGTLSQAWAGQVNSNGSSNGVALQQVNPSPSMPTIGESGNSLPVLTSGDLEFLQSNGPTSSQPRQDQPNQQIQQSQQQSQRQGLDAAHTWFNYGSQQPQSTQNGATGTGGPMGMGFSYTSSIDEGLLQNLMGNHHLKQENQGLSNMAGLGPTCASSSDCVQSFTALLNCPNTNGSTPETMRPMEASGTNQMVSQVPYPSSNMGQESHLDSYNWYFPE